MATSAATIQKIVQILEPAEFCIENAKWNV